MVTGSAVGAGIGGGALTGWSPADLVARVALGVAVAATGARAPRWLIASVALVGTLAGAATPAGMMSIAALGAAVALVLAGRRLAVVNAAAAGLVVQAALRLDWPAVTGGPSLLAAAMVLPLLVSGLRRLTESKRRRLAWGMGVVILLWGAGLAVGGLVAFRARTDVDGAIRAARAGLEAIEGAERDEAIAHLDEAAAAFARAHRQVGTWWARPAFVVPIAGHQMYAVHTVTAVGRDLADTAAREVAQVDTSALRLIDGQVDLAAIIRATGPIQRSAASLRRSIRAIERVRSPWLVEPIARRVDELEERVRDASGDAERAYEALGVAPALLGADGPRRYFLAVQTPAESRATGGLIGNFGEITADRGRLRLDRFGRNVDLNRGGDRAARRLVGPDDYVARYARFRPEHTWQNVNLSPDLRTVAEVVAGLYPQSGGRAIDGLITVDPIGLAAVLELVGPVEVGWPEPLTPQNVERILLHEQYRAFGQDERVDFLGDVTKVIWERLVSTTLPGPRELGRILAPAVRGRHLQVVSRHDAEVPFLRTAGLLGELAPPAPDFLAVISQNSGGNKIDWFLRRSITYEVRVHPDTGRLEADVTIVLRNGAPAAGLPRSVIGGASQRPTEHLGDNRMILSVYTPHELADVPTIDGEPLGVRSETELGRNVYTTGVVIPARSSRAVRLRLVGDVSRSKYSLTVHRQPLARPDRLEVRISAANAAAVAVEQDLEEDETFVVDLARRGARGFWRRFAPD